MREPTFFVCVPLIEGRKMILPDNLTGHCQICRTPVQYRPGGPEAAEELAGQVCQMICLLCATHDIDRLEERQSSLARPTH